MLQPKKGVQIQNRGHKSRRLLPLIFKATSDECVGSPLK